MALDRRKDSRLKIQVPVGIKVHNAKGLTEELGETTGELLDISESGARFRTHGRLSREIALTLYLVIPSFTMGETYLELPAVARMVTASKPGGPYDVGVEFTEIRPEDRRTLEKVLALLIKW